MKPILACDPGASGGIAWCFGDRELYAEPMPDTEGSVLDKLRAIRAAGIDRAIVEAQAGFSGGKMSHGALFTFARGYGFLLGCLMSLGYSIELVRPQKWQKELSLGSKKDSGGTGPWKRKLRSEAERLFPNADVTLKTADALLLLHFSQKQNL